VRHEIDTRVQELAAQSGQMSAEEMLAAFSDVVATAPIIARHHPDGRAGAVSPECQAEIDALRNGRPLVDSGEAEDAPESYAEFQEAAKRVNFGHLNSNDLEAMALAMRELSNRWPPKSAECRHFVCASDEMLKCVEPLRRYNREHVRLWGGRFAGQAIEDTK
jgi:hypothetical protein